MLHILVIGTNIKRLFIVVKDGIIVVSCSHKMRTKASMVATRGLFYQKNDDNVSHQVNSHGQLFRPYQASLAWYSYM